MISKYFNKKIWNLSKENESIHLDYVKKCIDYNELLDRFNELQILYRKLSNELKQKNDLYEKHVKSVMLENDKLNNRITELETKPTDAQIAFTTLEKSPYYVSKLIKNSLYGKINIHRLQQADQDSIHLVPFKDTKKGRVAYFDKVYTIKGIHEYTDTDSVQDCVTPQSKPYLTPNITLEESSFYRSKVFKDCQDNISNTTYTDTDNIKPSFYTEQLKKAEKVLNTQPPVIQTIIPLSDECITYLRQLDKITYVKACEILEDSVSHNVISLYEYYYLLGRTQEYYRSNLKR